VNNQTGLCLDASVSPGVRLKTRNGGSRAPQQLGLREYAELCGISPVGRRSRRQGYKARDEPNGHAELKQSGGTRG
jgi:hypothetical protein